MIFKIFNWLSKKISFTQATILICLIGAWLASIFCFFIVINRADFEATGTRQVFILTYISSIIMVSTLPPLFALKRKEYQILNANIISGHIRSDMKDQELLEFYNSFKLATKKSLMDSWIYPILVMGICAVVEWLVSGQLKNIPIILASGIIGSFFVLLTTVNVSILVNYPPLKECKTLLSKRGIPFKDFYITSLKMRLWLFMVFMALTLIGILILIYPFNLKVLITAFLGLALTGFSIYLVLASIYQALSEIKEGVAYLAKGEKAEFFSGSYDREIVELSQDLNKTAKNLIEAKRELEEAKTVLEIKVQARTRELKELAASLEEKVKERTKELQEKIAELEKFYKLAVGRELKMIELKKEIEKLRKEIEKCKKQNF